MLLNMLSEKLSSTGRGERWFFSIILFTTIAFCCTGDCERNKKEKNKKVVEIDNFLMVEGNGSLLYTKEIKYFV